MTLPLWGPVLHTQDWKNFYLREEKIMLSGISASLIEVVATKIFTGQNKSMEKDILLRSVLSECKGNLDFIKLIKKDAVNKEYKKSLRIFAKSLNNEFGQLILLNKFGVLSEIKLIQGDIDFQYEINNSSSLTENKDTDVYENPVDLKMAISFYVNKIQILKKLAELSDEELELFPKFLMNVRINNIENYLKIVKSSIANYFQK